MHRCQKLLHRHDCPVPSAAPPLSTLKRSSVHLTPWLPSAIQSSRAGEVIPVGFVLLDQGNDHLVLQMQARKKIEEVRDERISTIENHDFQQANGTMPFALQPTTSGNPEGSENAKRNVFTRKRLDPYNRRSENQSAAIPS